MDSKFPNTFDLSREVDDCGPSPVIEKPGKNSDKKKGKKRIIYPSIYVYNAPEGLASALKSLAASDSEITAIVKIRPTRLSEEVLVDKDDESREARDNVEFDIMEVSLPDAPSETADEEDAMESMKSAAKAAGVKFVGEEESEDEEEDEDEG